MHEYIIRSALPEDSIKLAELALKDFRGYPFIGIYDSESVKESIQRGENRLVAVENEEIIATAVLGEGKLTEIKRVLVSNQVRGKGLANILARELVAIAKADGRYPYAEVRSDQRGMQKAALNADLHPYSIEPGKHVVYWHEDIGAAREHMIYMSSIKILPAGISTLFNDYSAKFKTDLRTEMKRSHRAQLAPNIHLISAETSMQEVCEYLSVPADEIVHLYDMVVISVDKSAFLQNADTERLELLERAGIQVATEYVDVQNRQRVFELLAIGFIPCMIKPNLEKSLDLGLQMRMNGYQDSLYVSNIDPTIRSIIDNNISSIC